MMKDTPQPRIDIIQVHTKDELLRMLDTQEDPIGFIKEMQLPIPQSIGIIADGNGRWAKQQGKSITQGHRAGAQRVVDILRECRRLEQVHTVVVWTMSPDNRIRRDSDEVEGLENLTAENLQELLPELIDANARFRHIGRKEGLSSHVAHALTMAEAITAENTGQRGALAFNYDGDSSLLDGMRQAVLSSIAHIQENNQLPDVSDDSLRKYLDWYNIGQVNMMIRTSGEQRTSRIGRIGDRAEWHYPNVLMPDFSSLHLARELVDDAYRERRNGGRPKKNSY